MTFRRRSTPLSSAGVHPSDLCTECGHPASDHGENLPASCWSGCPEELRRPKTITAEVVAAIGTQGCRCIAFVPRASDRRTGAEAVS